MIARFTRDPLWKAYLALIVVYFVWSTTFGAIHMGVQTIPPAVLVVFRFTIAGALLLLWCLARGERWPAWADIKTHALIGLLIFTGGNTIVSWAMQYIPTGLGAVLTATNPFWMAWLSTKLPPYETMPRSAYLAFVIGFMGMVLLLLPRFQGVMDTSPAFWWSVAGIMVMGVSWSIGSILARKKQTQTSLFMGLAIQNLSAGLILTPVAFITNPAMTVHASWQSWAALAYLIVVGTIVAMSCYQYLLTRLPILVIGTIAYVTPVLTTLIGFWVFHEPINPVSMVGMAVILAGVIWIQRLSQFRVAQADSVPVPPITPIHPLSQPHLKERKTSCRS